MALAITLGYMLVARLSSGNNFWVQVSLPLSSVSLLLVALAAVETCLFVQRIQKTQTELETSRAQETELSQRLAIQRQTTLNQICRALFDNLDVTRISADILEKIAQLFEADAVAAWLTEKNGETRFLLKGAFGFTAHKLEQLSAEDWTFPAFEQSANASQPLVIADLANQLPPALGHVCERERVTGAVLTPIVCRNEIVGLLGVFYRNGRSISPSLMADMQAVANIMAGAAQAEALFHDLVQVQKIESIGTLAAGIAHDFNNVLAAILACASHVKQHTERSSSTYRYLEAMETSAHRGGALTKQLLAFARRQGPHLAVVNPNDCIEQTLKLLDRSFDKSILIQRQLAKSIHVIEVDPSQLEQVFINVAVNARDAMPDGGILTITTRNVLLDAADPFRPAVSLPNGDYVVISFRDTGCGMEAATLAHMFESFFTTKGAGKGTGLGLSLVMNIVKSFGGEIHVESQVGTGTLFEIFLPASKKTFTAAPTPPETTARGGHECILLAEDEDVIREMAQIDLESKGYKVLAAPDGATALSTFRDNQEEIDLVIADMMMPCISGPELFARMKEIDPGVRVIVSSGYSHDQEGRRMLRHGCLGYLQKPYNMESLNHLVRSVLDSGL
jgi:signal transduction histidine kinase/CheY-like chemotaxis protein